MRAGTKRMWLRRFLRVGDILAIIFKAPINGVKWALTDYNGRFAFINLFVCCIFGFMLFMVLSTFYGYHLQRTAASPSDIAEMLKGNPCMQEYLPRILKDTKEPITVSNLEYYDKQCKQTEKDAIALAAQKNFLKVEK